ncbi:MAG: DUF222 domain-containing protein [Microbacterium sp.]
MPFFTDLAEQLELLHAALGGGLGAGSGGDIEAAGIPLAVERLDDDAIVAALASATALVRAGELVRVAASGVAAARSRWESGHDGLAQKRGHRSPVSLIQEVTGATKAEAAKHVRLGEALRTVAGLDADEHDRAAAKAAGVDPSGAARQCEVWHAPLGRALLAGLIGSAQHDAILRGLGEPPQSANATPEQLEEFRETWTLAAEQLVAEARERTVEELARTARTMRDHLDPEGAQRRFDERFERRSFRMWTDGDGARRASIIFDDLGGAWLQTAMDAALRPRRGGPRFVDADEKARADALVEDPRTNDQLAYDLLLDIVRAGVLADAKSVFGTRQAGVRVIATRAALDADAAGRAAVGLVEDDQSALPAWLIAQRRCDTGEVSCALDASGNPLDLGREARLFTPKQRIALALRDGGCRWRGCDRPASYCEAHHIDQWHRDQGHTDIDRGILLCRFHHMQLHHGGWRITRDGKDDFLLHSPGGGAPSALRPRLGLVYAWAGVDPPPKRFRPAAA